MRSTAFLFYIFLIFNPFKCFLYLGDFEMFVSYLSVAVLGVLIYNVINCLTFRDLLKKFGFNKNSRKDFYECGFRPQNQRVLRLPIQFLLICIFFLMYDIELVFLFPYVSGFLFLGFFDSLLLTYFFLIFFLSLLIDYERHALYWQY